MERDDIIEYSLDAHHSEEKGVVLRKKIFQVTALLSIITAVEIAMGIFLGKNHVSPATWTFIKYSYIVMTLVKAGYIVMVFMHLGDERKSTKWMILGPYIFFIIYLLFIILTESNAVFHHNYNYDWINIFN